MASKQRADMVPTSQFGEAGINLLETFFGNSDRVETLEEDSGLEVGWGDGAFFVGKYDSVKTIPVDDPNDKNIQRDTNLYTFTEIACWDSASEPAFGSDEKVTYDSRAGMKRAIWGNYQIDKSMAKVNIGDRVLFEFKGKKEGKDRPVNVFNIHVARA